MKHFFTLFVLFLCLGCNKPGTVADVAESISEDTTTIETTDTADTGSDQQAGDQVADQGSDGGDSTTDADSGSSGQGGIVANPEYEEDEGHCVECSAECPYACPAWW